MKLKLRALCCFLAAVTLLGTVGCQKSDVPVETSASSDTVAETVREEETEAEDTADETDPNVENPPADTVLEEAPPEEPLPEEPLPEDPLPDEPIVDNSVTITGEIQYELTRAEQSVGDGVALSVPAEGQTGVTVTASLQLQVTLEDYNYFVVDWGDGTWSYNGPYESATRATLSHIYKQAGTYEVKGCSVNLEAGRRKGWTESKTVVVSGETYTPDNMITKVTPIGSTTAGDGYAFANIADGDNATRWQSQLANKASVEEYIGYIFDDTYTLDMLEIKFPAEVTTFPSNISIEYTTDGGETWYMMPHYYYVLPNEEPVYDCLMNFPNPQGATLVLPMEGICANGVRLHSLQYGRSGREFGVEEMRVYGKAETLFYSSYDGYFDSDLTNMWTIFGLAVTEPGPFRSGGTMITSTEWFEWNGMKLNWTGYDQYVSLHAQLLKDAVYGGDGWYYDEATGEYVVDESEYDTNPRNDGYIWATGGSPKHLDADNHYTYNSILIIASRDYLLTGNDTEEFLSSVNGRGQVMIDKLRKAMEYMLYNLNGESGLMTIYDPRNNGTVHAHSANYWDAMLWFGYNSSYENIMFYEALLAMADIETFIGNTEAADYYLSVSARVKETFNDYFWDAEKGRYITSVNAKGDRLDFGVTFVNFMAVDAGLASPEQAKLIYDWIDGTRIIEGDTSTGEDIYHFGVAARSNTVAIETIEEDGLHYWGGNGHEWVDCLPGMGGQYGMHMQNGGTIFYISHYDVAGRTLLSGDLAMERFNAIMDEFHTDSLRRDPRTQWGVYQVSINGEFPESGLVPLTFLTHIMGVTPDVEGLRIEASLPSDMTYAGVREYHYNNLVYRIEVNKELTEPSMALENGVYVVKFPADKAYFITRDNEIVEAAEEEAPTAPTLGVPGVSATVHTVCVDELAADVVIAVDFGGGTLESVTCNGVEVDELNYHRGILSLTLRENFVRYLPVGENTVTVTTNGGSVAFVLNVEREGVLFTDSQRIKAFTGEDVGFTVDLGTSGIIDGVTLGGEALPEAAYTYENGVLYIRREYLAELAVGAYEVWIYGAGESRVDCIVAVGVEPQEVYALNFDSFINPTGGVISMADVEGFCGTGGRVVCRGSGNLFRIGADACPYDFEAGRTYGMTMYLKFEESISSTSLWSDLLMRIGSNTTAGYAEVLYLRYNEERGYYIETYQASVGEFTCEDGWYRLYFEFTYGDNWNDLTVPVWMTTTFTVDSVIVAPVE